MTPLSTDDETGHRVESKFSNLESRICLLSPTFGVPIGQMRVPVAHGGFIRPPLTHYHIPNLPWPEDAAVMT